jgi:hypothetical protein
MITGLLAFAAAQDWAVVETDTHRIVHPTEATAWTEDLASRLPALRAAVEDEVGVTLSGRTHVLVRDPWAVGSGAAYPLGRSPRMELWAQAPMADGELGHHGRPTDLFLAHEETHLVHLLTRPRSVGGQFLFELFGMSPLLRKCPPWVIEGYATLVEGRVTGWGRPTGATRATLLRRLAQTGRLPSWGTLDGRWRYTVGSAFLGWLDDREGGDSLKRVWTRLAARERRTLDEAMAGVYGAPLRDLYSRFRAELTADAMDADGAAWRRATQWMRLRGPAKGIAVSPDGERMALVRRSSDGIDELVVVELAVDEARVQRRAREADALLATDPDDVADKPLRLAPHRVVHRFTTRTHSPAYPRWIDDQTLLYDAPAIDGDGRVRRELYTYDLARGRPSRLTRQGDVRRADVRDGVVWAVHSAWGATALARVDLATGAVTLATTPSVRSLVDQPRIGPDGTLAWLQNDGDGWTVRTGTPSASTVRPLPPGATAVNLAWDGEDLLASLATDGRFDIWRLRPDGAERLTDTGGAQYPEPGPDGVFHLELEPDRHDVHLLRRDGPVLADRGRADGLAAAEDHEHVTFAAVPVRSRPLGLGPQHLRLVGGGMVGLGGSTLEAGVRTGDLAGRHEAFLAASFGDGFGYTGAGAWFTRRGGVFEPVLRAWGLQGALRSPVAFGASAEARQSTGSSTTQLDWTGGTWGEGSTAGFRGGTFGSVSGGWLEPRGRGIWTWAALTGTAGVDDGPQAQLGAQAGATFGRGWELSVEGGATVSANRPIALGGVTSGLLPEAAQWHRTRDGWQVTDSDAGQLVVDGAIGLGSEGVGIAYEYVAIDGRPWSFVGVRFETTREGESLFGIPGLFMRSGMGCALHQGDRPRRDVCQRLADVRTWTQLTWQP